MVCLYSCFPVQYDLFLLSLPVVYHYICVFYKTSFSFQKWVQRDAHVMMRTVIVWNLKMLAGTLKLSKCLYLKEACYARFSCIEWLTQNTTQCFIIIIRKSNKSTRSIKLNGSLLYIQERKFIIISRQLPRCVLLPKFWNLFFLQQDHLMMHGMCRWTAPQSCIEQVPH